MNRLTIPMLLAALLLSGCARESAQPQAMAADALEGSRWQLASASQGPLAELDAARRVTMAFDAAQVSGSDGCNRYVSGYQLDGSRLTLAAVATTKMFCAGDGSIVEKAFLDVLAAPMTLSRQNGGLQLEAADGNMLRFEPEIPPGTATQ